MKEKKDLRPYNRKELAVLYNRTVGCFRTMMKPFVKAVGKKMGRYYTIKQVAIIFEKLGHPDCFLKDEYTPKTPPN